jgi:hypothetical protein
MDSRATQQLVRQLLLYNRVGGLGIGWLVYSKIRVDYNYLVL